MSHSRAVQTIKLTNSDCTLQLVEAGHKSRGEAGVGGSDEDQRLNYREKFCCRFAVDSANSDLRILLLIVGRGGALAEGLLKYTFETLLKGFAFPRRMAKEVFDGCSDPAVHSRERDRQGPDGRRRLEQPRSASGFIGLYRG